ncbi:uncharacterized protein BCR38DRAFT_117875 [Pseudomassariella vexata]|uniref:Uncharacterized protein n=1 Tax=Pseudomassariella vexata TaxID=1141098 RepID=A0A1Y2DAR4_9PEZI|nr:uncharacterized protein BCR38DRAFT_117875 [Pseudomassariella vexata]ORY56360.1 hypothetical protein BCR38DRAFT_117875 [Pseudomassariella vexata]
MPVNTRSGKPGLSRFLETNLVGPWRPRQMVSPPHISHLGIYRRQTALPVPSQHLASGTHTADHEPHPEMDFTEKACAKYLGKCWTGYINGGTYNDPCKSTSVINTTHTPTAGNKILPMKCTKYHLRYHSWPHDKPALQIFARDHAFSTLATQPFGDLMKVQLLSRLGYRNETTSIAR